ncbi:MAG: metal-dependent hydrolase, partial [Acidobacteriota bacterium]
LSPDRCPRMENLTHTLVGAALAESGLKRVTPLATPTLIIAANIPDIDIVSGVFGPMAYLEWHRGITHSLIGFPLLALLLALVVYLCSRRLCSRRRARFWPLLALSLIGTATHPFLDFTNSYGWRPFLPWSERWFFSDIAFVADPWIWLGVGGAVFLATSATRSRQFLWVLLFAALTLLLILAPMGWTVRLVWLTLVAVTGMFKLGVKLDDRGQRLVNRCALVALGLYLALLTVLHGIAIFNLAEVARVAISANEQVVELSALATEANPLRWRAMVATETAFHFGDLQLVAGKGPVLERVPREQGQPDAIEAARQTERARRFLRFARFPVLRAREVGDGAEVDIEDLRFSGVTNRFRITVKLDRNLKPSEP